MSKIEKIGLVIVLLWFSYVAFSIAFALSHVEECQRLGYEEVTLDFYFNVTCERTERLELP